MILLNSGSNSIALTLTENTTITGSVTYLFELLSENTDLYKTFISQDSGSKDLRRYNLFNITITGSEDLLSGSVDLERGNYTYTIYQQGSLTNLTSSLADGIVEQGKLRVLGTRTPLQLVYTGSSTEDIVYQG